MNEKNIIKKMGLLRAHIQKSIGRRKVNGKMKFGNGMVRK
jgi:hypothetical protein